MEKINLTQDTLKNLPLFFRIIYHNQVSEWQEEEKLFKYSPLLQAQVMCGKSSTRQISKTIDHKIFKQHENHQ